MRQQDVVRLTAEERDTLAALIAAGAGPARAQAHARVLLKADRGDGGPAWTDAAVAEAVEVSVATVARVRRRWATEGLADALHHRRPAARRPRRLDGAAEARLVALACSAPPEGQARWTLRLLAGKLVELEVVAGIAPNTVRATLKKTTSSRG